MGTKNSRHYTTEFKQDAVNYYHSSGKSMAKVAEELQVSQASINNWIQNAKKNEGTVSDRGAGNYASDEAKEIAQLKKELRDAQAAIDILKKAMSILND
ncbi:transposase [Vallitalea pronyensis]|uniref:Transposase n=1 Tax=Vallitalea pronyensis TaxID=1348613 RepID=A0A8J8MG71_9FIRM|nr:transposase [Vallitalea pronyensis]QUI20881.1 transposase [Vallitalea pronyensis]